MAASNKQLPELLSITIYYQYLQKKIKNKLGALSYALFYLQRFYVGFYAIPATNCQTSPWFSTWSKNRNSVQKCDTKNVVGSRSK